MQEHHIRVTRTARYYTLGDPAQASELWFVLHGYSQLAGRFLRQFRAFASPERLIVAPEALNRYYFEHAPGHHHADARVGATWMTREDREAEIRDYVAYLDDLCDAVSGGLGQPPDSIGILGFSQGVATAGRWVAAGRVRPERLVLWGGWLPAELPVTPTLFHRAELVFVYGRNDDYTPAAKVAVASERLLGGGLPHRVVWFDGGHELQPQVLSSLP